MASEFKIKNGLIVVGDVSTSGTITINGALAATQSWVTSQAYLTSSSLTSYATQSYVTSAIASLVDSAPGALDTLRELATALGNDASFSTTITNSIAAKLPLAGGTLTGLLTAPKISLTSTGNDYYLNLNGLTLTSITTGETIWRNLYALRFSDVNDWDYNSWAGLKFINSTKQIVLGVAGNIFTANNPQTGTLLLDRISTVYVNNTSQTVWHSGNLTNLNQLSNGPGYITASALSPYLPLAGGTLTGALTGTSATFSGDLRIAGVGTKLYFDTLSVPNSIYQYVENNYDLHFINTRGDGARFVLGNNIISFGTVSAVRFSISQVTGAATLSSSLTVERIQINSTTYEPLAINSSYGQVGLKFGLNGSYFAAIGSANNVTGAYAGSETDLGIGTYGSATANITFATGTGLGRRMTITAAGNIGIGTTTPQKKLDVFGSAGIVASIGASIGVGQFAGLHFGYSESSSNNDSYKKSALVFERTDSHGQGGNASGKIHFLLNNIASTSANALTDSVVTIDSDASATAGSVRMGIGTRNPSSALEVIGTIRNKNASVNSNYSQLSTTEATLTLSTYSINTASYPANIIFSPASTEAMRINTAGKVSIGTTDSNSDKSDFTVYTGGNTSIALAGNLFRVGESDINWDIALRQNGTLQTYGQALNLNTQAGNYAVNVQPNGTTVAQFYQDYSYFPGLDFSISRVNGVHASNYFRGDGSHLVIGTGGTLYLNYANTSGITYIFGTTYINNEQVATRAWVGSQNYLTSVSDIWVNTTGDTMTGALTIQGGWASTILDGDNVVLRKPNYSSGGWARTLLNFQEYDTTSLFQIGGYGSNNTMTYGYLGSAYNTPTFRWYANKDVIFSGKIIIDDVLDDNRYQKGNSFLNLRDPYNNIHLRNGGDGVYVDSNIHHWRSAGSTYWMKLDNGNLGIGTQSPQSKLHVISNENADAAGAIRTTALNLSQYADYSFGGITSSYFYRIVSGTNQHISLMPGGTGNVGIGTTSPNSTLHVYNNADVWHTRIGGASGELRIGGQTASGAVIQALEPGGAIRQLYLQRDGGNVGIGTSSPSAILQINGAGGDSTPTLRLISAASDTFNWASDSRYANLTAGKTSIHLIGKANSQYNQAYFGYRHVADGSASNMLTLGLYASDYLLNILGNGNVGIGTTTPGDYKLYVNGGQFGTLLKGGDLGTGSDVVRMIKSDGSCAMIVRGDGNIGIGTFSPTAPLEITNTGGSGGGLTMFTSSYYSNLKYWGMRIYGIDNGNGIHYSTDVQVGADWYSATRVGHGQNATNPSFQSYYTTYLATNGGNVGIGTTSPSYKLDVNGSFRSAGFWSGASAVSFWGGGASETAYGVLTWDTGYAKIYATSGNKLYLGASGGNNHITIDTSGNVGIGSTAPVANFQIGQAQSGAAFNLASKIKIVGTPQSNVDEIFLNLVRDRNPGVQYAGAASFKLGSYVVPSGGTPPSSRLTIALKSTSENTDIANVDVMSLLDNGNVGIGITSPVHKLTFDNNTFISFNNDLSNPFGIGGGDNAMTRIVMGSASGASSSIQFGVGSSGQYSGFTSLMTIKSSGNIGINTTTPSYKLHVNGTFGFAGSLYGDGKKAIDVYDSWLRLNQDAAFGSGVYTPYVLRNDGEFINYGGIYGYNAIKGRKSQSINNYTTAALWTESYDNTTTGIAFHISGNVGKFLEMRTNGILYWDNAQVWTAGTLTNLNQLTNGPGYITSSGSISGSAGYTQTLALTGLGSATTNVNNGGSAVYRNENGLGGNLNYAPVLHLGGGDTMWQIQGDYYNSTDLRWRAGYAGTWYAWRQIYHSGNFTDNSSNWNTAYSWGNHASASYATTSYVTTQINNLVNGAPGALDTLNELATALGNDASFSTTVTNSIAGKVSKAGDTMTGALTLNAGLNAYASPIYVNEIRFRDTAGSPASDPYSMRWVSENSARGAGLSWLEFQLNDDDNEEIRIYGNSCVGYGCGATSENLYHRFRADGYAWHAGNLSIGGFLTESSSLKLKENVKTSEGNLEKVVNLRPVTYNKIGSQTTELGLIAEEVATVYPEFVQYDENGEPIGVNYSRLTAALIGAVKELTQRIETLENNG